MCGWRNLSGIMWRTKRRCRARAYAYRDENSRAYFLYEGETAVGMGLYYDCPELGAYEFSQFFIDQRYQGRGLALPGQSCC